MESPAPAERTVGQLVAEAIRLYGAHFWSSLALGLVVAAVDQLAVGQDRGGQAALLIVASPLFTLAYIRACVIATGERPRWGIVGRAFAVGVLVFLPVGLLVWVFVLPALAWLAYAGLSVPVTLFEQLGFRDALRRAARLAQAEFLHALGSLATLVIVYIVARSALVILLAGQAEAAGRTAVFFGDLVLSPLLFLGAALLYFDQKGRLESHPRRERSRDADVHHAQQPDRSGRPDAEVEPGPAEGGQQGR